MTVHIRTATREDRNALIHFNQAMAKETEGRVLDHELLSAGVDAVYDDAEKGFYLIAAIDGEPAGGLLVTTEWSDWRNAYFWWIQSVYVEPKHRKMGAYTALHRHVETLASSAGNVCGIRLYVDRDNTRAKATYERLGMAHARYDFYEISLPTEP
jgi:GNAT superfamily N-acetyltransferase